MDFGHSDVFGNEDGLNVWGYPDHLNIHGNPDNLDIQGNEMPQTYVDPVESE